MDSIKIRTTFSDIKAYMALLGQYIKFLTKYGKVVKYTTGYERGSVKEKAHFHTHFIMEKLKLPKTNLQQTYKYYCKKNNLKIIPGKYTLSMIAEKADSHKLTLAYPLKNCEGPLGLADRGELMRLSNLDNEEWTEYFVVGRTIREQIVKREEKKKQEKAEKNSMKEKLFKYIDEHLGDDKTVVEIGMLVERYYFEHEDDVCMNPDRWVMRYMRTKQYINDYDVFNYLSRLRN